MLKFIQYEIKNKGAIFCQVIKIKAFIQDNPSIISGNQKWKGAVPLFKNRVERIIFSEKFWKTLQFKLKNRYKLIIENKRIIEAKAWVKKYFKDLSVEIILLLFIRGINDNKLISNPIHTLIQELAEILIKVPIIKHKMNNK